MTDFDLKLCDVQGRLFVLSAMQGYGSNKFVKTFMKSETARELVIHKLNRYHTFT